MLTKYLLLLIVVGMTATGCGTAVNQRAVQLDNGVIDLNYQGVAKPVVPKILKLSEQEMQQGFQKFPLRSRTGQILTPEVEVTDKPNLEQGGTDSSAAKPQV